MSAAAELTGPEQILRAFDGRHPGIWQYITRCRDNRDWPDWCYIPVSVAHVFVARELRVPLLAAMRSGDITESAQALAAGYDAGITSTLAAWRMGRGVYRFDPDFAQALTATPLAGDIPVDVLLHMPEWAVYVEMDVPPVVGFFASLEWDAGRAEAEMRLLFDTGDPAPTLLPLPLTASNIAEMLDALHGRIRQNAAALGFNAALTMQAFDADESLGRIVQDTLPGALNMLLYLCSPEAEYKGGVRPERPAVVKTKRGERMFPAATPRVWRIGEGIGARLRAASADRDMPEERNAPRPHLRRAHWHTYRVGKGRSGYRPRWLHPILVGYREDD